MSLKVFKVINKYKQDPNNYENIPHRNIFLTKGEAKLFKVCFELENPGIELIIMESEVTWIESGY